MGEARREEKPEAPRRPGRAGDLGALSLPCYNLCRYEGRLIPARETQSEALLKRAKEARKHVTSSRNRDGKGRRISGNHL